MEEEIEKEGGNGRWGCNHQKDRMYSCVGTKSAAVPPAAKEVMSSAWGGVKRVSASKKARGALANVGDC